MAVGAGFNGFVGLTTETTWGTAVAVAAAKMNRAKSCDFVNQAEPTDGANNLGRLIKLGQRVHGRRGQGSVSFDMHYQGLETWLDHWFGVNSRTSTAGGGGESAAITHVWLVKTAQKVGASLEVHADLNKHVFPGVKFSRCTITGERPGVPVLSFDGMGKKQNAAGTVEASPTFLEDVVPAPPINAIEYTPAVGFTFQTGDAGTFANPSAVINIDRFSVEMAKPFQGDRGYLGSQDIAEPLINGLMDCTGSFTREYIDATLLADFLAGTPKYLRFKYEAGVIPGVVTTKWTLQVDVPNARYLGAGMPLRDAGAIMEEMPFLCDAPTGTDTPVRLTLINKRTSADIA